MFKCLILIFLFSVNYSLGQKVNFKLTGNLINKTNAKTLYIVGSSIDSTKIQSDNSFSYSGKLKNPELMMLSTEHSYVCNFWANTGNINIEIEDDILPSTKTNGKVKMKINSLQGPYETTTYNNIADSIVRINKKYKLLSLNNDTLKQKEISSMVSEFVIKNPNSYLSPLIVRLKDLPTTDKFALLKIMIDNPDTTAMNNLRAQIKQSIFSDKGLKIENFTQKTVNGKLFNLYSLKSQFILLEFWSSHCIPCRAENPNWKKLYSQYHSKGLEIVGVSLDDDHSEWKNAIKNDGLPWVNVSDLLGFNNRVAQKFMIDHIPFNILLDSSFAILATNVGTSEVVELMNKKASTNVN